MNSPILSLRIRGTLRVRKVSNLTKIRDLLKIHTQVRDIIIRPNLR